MNGKTRVVLIASLAVLVALAVALLLRGRGSESVSLQTAAVAIGTIRNTVTATGTVEPMDKVAVGTQVSGVVQSVLVDYNSHVKKGQLIARLDMTTLKATVEQSQSQLRSAQAEAEYQSGIHERTTKLFAKNLASQEDADKAQYDHARTQAAVEQALSALKRARINLDYASIYSPIDGIVLSRAVDEGQTVAASLNTPTLFTIARDLTRMEVQVNVDEADIGQVHEGQRATFNVDAFPGRSFDGSVTQVRLEPTVTSNVVTYTVIISTANPDNTLMPGMTATVAICTREADSVLTVAAKALRFRPDAAVLRSYLATLKGAHRGPPPPEPGGASPQTGADSSAHVWVTDGLRLHPVAVETGISDGTLTEVVSGLKVGDLVVVGMESGRKTISGLGSGTQAGPATASPFMPRPPGRPTKAR